MNLFDLGSLFTYFYPHLLTLAYLTCLFTTPVPDKLRIFARALVALAVVSALAHVNRLFNLWPAYLCFPSGHMTFAFGLSLSLALLRPWTASITLPLLIPFGTALVVFGFHSAVDVLGAIPLVILIYGILYPDTRPLALARPLDSREGSA